MGNVAFSLHPLDTEDGSAIKMAIEVCTCLLEFTNSTKQITSNYSPTLCSSNIFPVVCVVVIINFKRRRHAAFI